MQIITFFGGDRNIGTTQICQGCCELFASKDFGEKVLYIDASQNRYIGYSGRSLTGENASPGIDMIGKIIRPNQAVVYVDGYDAILGPRGISRRSYPKDFFEEIFKELGKDTYSRVLIDAGSDITDPLTKMALRVADRRVYIVRQNPKCLEKFLDAAERYLLPLSKENKSKIYLYPASDLDERFDLYKADDLLIINAERKSRLLYPKDEVDRMLSKNSYSLPFIEKGLSCEYTRKSLVSTSKKFRNALKRFIVKNL